MVDTGFALRPEARDETGSRAELVVRTEGLCKSFGSTRALDDVSLSVRRGEVFAYLGPNGAGKTTTIRVLLGMLRPTAGRAAVFGLDSWTDSVVIHRQVGYVPGEVTFWDRMTVLELLTFLASLRGTRDLSYARVLSDRLDLDLARVVTTMSKGNRQKVAIVQALMTRPELLVLDEPTSGLDPLVQQQVHDLLREHVDGGGTVLLSSHVLSEVQRIADRVGIIRSGRLVAVERLDDLRAKSLHSVSVRFDAPVDAEPFRRLEGVRDVTVQGTVLTLGATQGALDAVVKQSARHTVLDLSCEEASLEEMFLAYYGPGGGHGG
jgi:ABC-2 type transport system ATP-binding protein